MPLIIEGGEPTDARETQWGVSLTSSNPEPEDYYRCNSEAHAVSLLAALQGPVAQRVALEQGPCWWMSGYVVGSLPPQPVLYGSLRCQSDPATNCERCAALEGAKR